MRNFKPDLKEKLHLAESRLSLPDLAERIGRPISERPGTCRSPFRDERRPSFSWRIAHDGRARWKDFGTGEGGDAPSFLSKALGLSNADACIRYLELAGISETNSGSLPELKPIALKPITPKEPEKKENPKLPHDLHPGTVAEVQELIELRGWDVKLEHLHEICSQGFLRFGTWQGERAWFLVDPAGRFFEARRMDGKNWSNGAKSDSRGSKSLLGAEHVQAGGVALLVEGAPDFLACAIYKSIGLKESTCFALDAVPVAMLGAGVRLKDEDLKRFKGVSVIIFPHLDTAGRNAKDTWKAQLRKAGAIVGDLTLTSFVYPGGKDLADTIDPIPSLDLIWRIEAKAEQLNSETK